MPTHNIVEKAVLPGAAFLYITTKGGKKYAQSHSFHDPHMEASAQEDRMKIGLIDVDGHNGHPNLALMKLSAFHKAHADQVEWWNGFEHYDRVYMSKVFTFTPDFNTVIHADEVIKGGTGYKNYKSLPAEVETTRPDYSLYPGFDAAIGFLTRGCVRKCAWCIVPKKEGSIRAVATWQEIKRPESRKIIFLDNNVLASGHGIQQIEEMGNEKIWLDFNQGLDARLITPEIAGLLARLHWIRFIRLACDTSEMLPIIEQATRYMIEAGVSRSRFWAYVLVQEIEDAHKRVVALESMGVTPFAQPYRDYEGTEPPQIQKDFARWVNNRAVFKSCTWRQYKNQ